jgi:AraC-like DNA-binding protein
MSNYTIKKINSVKDFVDLIEKIKEENVNRGNKSDLLCRGQQKDEPLLPKLARLNLNGEIDNVEKLILEEFKKGILPLSEFKPEDEWDLLALAQHHGLPTRLLDWTFSALTALCLLFVIHQIKI